MTRKYCFHPDRTKSFPVSAVENPLSGRTTGPVYLPPPAVGGKFFKGLAWALGICFVAYGALIMLYSGGRSLLAVVFGD